jgi:CRP-like cAMP-binding protein
MVNEFLHGIKIFDGLSEAQVNDLASLFKEEAVNQGEEIFSEGQVARSIYILVEGHVSLRIRLTSRPQYALVGSIKDPGQLIGWSGVIAPHHYTASAVCKQDTRLLSADGQEFLRKLEQDPSMGVSVLRSISETISDRLRNCRLASVRAL